MGNMQLDVSLMSFLASSSSQSASDIKNDGLWGPLG